MLFGLAALFTGRDLHLALAALAFGATVLLAALVWRGEVEDGPARDYITLTKPRIMSLLLLTGAAGVFVGAGGVPAASTFAFTMIGLALACGGASALNHYLDRDIDRLMGSRTEQRPVASGRVPPERALEFGLALSAFSFVLLDSLVNLPTALLALAGNLFYVLVYTRWLKRSTSQNIVIGGAAGAVPPLVGYAGAAGHLGWAAVAMFAIVFMWTPPHFWALALMIKEHYARAGVPMLPVERGERETAKQIVWYTAVLIVVTLVPAALGDLRARLRDRRGRARRRVRVVRARAPSHARATVGIATVPLLAPLPRAALRRNGAGHGDLGDRAARRAHGARNGGNAPARRPGRRARPPEPAVRLGAGRAVRAPVRRHGRSRVRVPLAELAGIWITELADAAAPVGRRLAVKDLFDTAGVRTTYGSAVFADHVPATSAEAVLRLEAAGWVDVGKTNLHEFAYGVTSQNHHYGIVPNPLAPGRTSGGSSGGSAAALAAGLADGALGSDTGGSIRIPAACCGVTGFKPTYGLVPADGVFPLAPSYDHVGPMARDVAGCVDLTQALVPGFEPLGVACRRRRSPSALRGSTRVRRSCASGCSRLPRLFRSAEPIEFPMGDGTQAMFMREIADVHRELYAEAADLYGENIRPKIERCLEVSDAEVAEAVRARDVLRADGRARPRRAAVAAHADAGVRRAVGGRRRDRRARVVRPVHVPVQRTRVAGARAACRAGRGRPTGIRPARRTARRRRVRARGRARAGGGTCTLTCASRTSWPTRPTR